MRSVLCAQNMPKPEQNTALCERPHLGYTEDSLALEGGGALVVLLGQVLVVARGQRDGIVVAGGATTSLSARQHGLRQHAGA